MDNKYQYLKVFKCKENETILIVKLNRPHKRNAINSTFWREIGQLFGEGLDVDYPEVQCIILSAEGGNIFCAGIDLTDETFQFAFRDNQDGQDGGDVARRIISWRPIIQQMQAAFTAVEECRVPVIACVDGPCIGGGVDLICCTDIRICSSRAIFSVKEVQVGLAADIGTLQRLPKLVGYSSLVKELCYTGRSFSAVEAKEIGFVSQVIDNNKVEVAAVKLGQAIVSNSPIAIYGTKLSMNYSRDRSIQEGLDHIALHNSAALLTEDIGRVFTAAISQTKEKDLKFPPLLPSARL